MKNKDETIDIGKSIWTEEDFDLMGWHDVHIHGIAFHPEQFELYFDVDYIFAWIDPTAPDAGYSFWVAPCTWLFKNVYNFEVNVSGNASLEISDVSREFVGVPKNSEHIGRDEEWRWLLDCQEGNLSFISIGFQLFVRRRPVHVRAQVLDWTERGGVCFDKTVFDE